MKARRGEERMLAVITLGASLLAAAAAAAPAEVLRSTDGRVLAAARSRGPDVGFDERRARVVLELPAVDKGAELRARIGDEERAVRHLERAVRTRDRLVAVDGNVLVLAADRVRRGVTEEH